MILWFWSSTEFLVGGAGNCWISGLNFLISWENLAIFPPLSLNQKTNDSRISLQLTTKLNLKFKKKYYSLFQSHKFKNWRWNRCTKSSKKIYLFQKLIEKPLYYTKRSNNFCGFLLIYIFLVFFFYFSSKKTKFMSNIEHINTNFLNTLLENNYLIKIYIYWKSFLMWGYFSPNFPFDQFAKSLNNWTVIYLMGKFFEYFFRFFYASFSPKSWSENVC